MSFFLGIYCKNSQFEGAEFELLIRNFTLNGSRQMEVVQYPFFRLYIANGNDQKITSDKCSCTLVRGYLSSPGVGLNDPSAYLIHSEGAFTLVHYNTVNNKLVLANDKFGVFSMFIKETNNHIIFSNEYEPLSSFKSLSDLDYASMAEFFTLGSVLGNKTFLKNIIRLGPANLIMATNNSVQNFQYWHPHMDVDYREPSILAKEMYDLFTKVNNELSASGIADTYLLSAGADSRFILATLNKDISKKVKFYTSNLSFLSEEEDRDVIGAKLIAEKFGLDHKTEKVAHYEYIFDETYFKNFRRTQHSHVYGGWLGGELLGGFCFNVAPVKSGITKRDIDLSLKSIFSKKFIKSLNTHPFDSYSSTQIYDTHFYLQQLIQPFFTCIYSGSRGYWVQPYQLTNHGFSPFWDSRIIQKVLTIPKELLANYNFYNEVFKNVDPEFLAIESNSPLTGVLNSVIKPIKMGVEPKLKLPNVHHDAHMKCMNSENVWAKNFYRKRKLKKILAKENDEVSKRWLDFEIWLKYYLNS